MIRFVAIFSVFLLSFQAYAQEMFTGDKKLACEAIICLSTGSPPNECQPALRKYFSINFSNFSKTLKERKNFLDLSFLNHQPYSP